LHKAYKYSILYFIVFSLLLLASGFLLFEEKIGLSVHALRAYYLGDEALFMSAKSTQGLLKIVLPHIFAFALLSMVLLHFLKFTNTKNKKALIVLIYALFSAQFFEIFAPFFMLHISELFVYVKLFSLLVYFGLMLITLHLLFASIAFSKK
jgi:hypothetical protein